MRTQDNYKNVWQSPRSTVSNGVPTRKDSIMKTIYLLTFVLAISCVEGDQQAEYNVNSQEIYYKPVVNKKIPPSQRVRDWQTHQAIKAPNSWKPEVQNDYYGGSPSAPQQPAPSTTPVPVIKNEFYQGDNGDYKYEYQIADGTSVGEQGYFNNKDQSEDSLVKKGWYSFLGADGITYTVTYWADHTGYHAYGSHLPAGSAGNIDTPSQQGSNELPSQSGASSTQMPNNPSKPAYPSYNPPQEESYNPPQQSYDTPQPTYNPPQQIYNPPQQTYNPPQQIYNPPQQIYNPPQQTYNPPQQTYNPPQQIYNPAQQTYNPPQQTYNPPQQTYNPPQQSYNPPQQTYNPPQQTYNPPQQIYNPPQSSYNQPQQQSYYPNYNV